MTAKNTRRDVKRQDPNSENPDEHLEPVQPVSVVPLIVEDGLYSREQIIAALAISSATLNQWLNLAEGERLKSGQRGTKRRYFRGRDVMSFLVGES